MTHSLRTTVVEVFWTMVRPRGERAGRDTGLVDIVLDIVLDIALVTHLHSWAPYLQVSRSCKIELQLGQGL